MKQGVANAAEIPWLGEAEGLLPDASLRRIALLALLTIVVGFGGIVAWAALAHVESAVPGTGAIVSGGRRKTVSLVESGTLRALLVGEGDRVVRNQVLFRLDDTQARAVRSQAGILYWSTAARAARLAAEAADRRELSIPAPLRDAAASDPVVAAAAAAEASHFHARWSALDASVQVQRRKIAQQQAHIDALRAQTSAAGLRLGFLREELRTVEFLKERGLSTRPHELELRRADADLQGQVGLFAAQSNEARQAIAQVEAETIATVEGRRSDIARENAETHAALADAEQRLGAAEDLLRKREITAPESGTVTDIRLFTPGSSIQAGQPVMDLVPDSPELLVEARIAPWEVERLAVGQHVNVRLTAYKAHRVPVLPGRLSYVGADRQVDPNNQPFFLVRAEIDAEALRDKRGVLLLPGMPADILIVNGARSVLDFLIAPIADSMHRAMKEE